MSESIKLSWLAAAGGPSITAEFTDANPWVAQNRVELAGRSWFVVREKLTSDEAILSSHTLGPDARQTAWWSLGAPRRHEPQGQIRYDAARVIHRYADDPATAPVVAHQDGVAPSIDDAIAALERAATWQPEQRRGVLWFRDGEGWVAVVDGDELGVSETSAHAGDQAWTWFRSHKRATQMAELLGAETFPGSFGGVVATRDEAELAALGVVARFRALVDEYLRA